MEMLKKIYEELNKKYNCLEIYVQDFTAEQIYYQIEDLCDKVILENEIKINKLYEKFLKFNKEKFEIITEENFEEVVDEFSNLSNEVEDVDDSESFEEKKKLLDEEVSEELSSIEEDTLSDEGSIEDIEEIKDNPASEIFKKLDKNIK